MAEMAFGQFLIMLLLGGLLPHDTEPMPADEVMLHMPADCEVMAFEDLRGVGDTIDTFMADLSTQAWIIANDEFREGFQAASEGFGQLEAMAVEMLGINPFDDLTAISLCMKMRPGPPGMPDYLVVVQGNFDSTLADRLGADGFEPVVLSSGASIYGTTEDGTIIGLAVPRPGVLVFGSENYLTSVAAPVAPTAIVPPAGSMLARVAELAPHGIRSFVGFRPGAALKAVLASEAPVTVAELTTGLDRAMWFTGDSVDLIEVRATGTDTHRDYELILSGIGAIAQASPLAMAGMANIFLGVLSPDDPDLEEGLRSLATHREEILTMLDTSGLLAPTEVEVTSDAGTFTTTLSLTNAQGGSGAVLLLMLGGLSSIALLGSSSEPPYDGREVYERSATEVAPTFPTSTESDGRR
jgi:hypothetical protein